tara:strand:+ start:155 stop:583 length:429 start_codon:yes stop_codon:yes gene_type:complete
MVDHLEPDATTVPGQKYALISVVSPVSKQKNDTCAVKIKGVFEDVDAAKKHAAFLSKLPEEKDFDIFLVEMYKWLPIPPNVQDIEDKVYQDERLNAIIQEHKDEQIRARDAFEDRKRFLAQGKMDPLDSEEPIDPKGKEPIE